RCEAPQGPQVGACVSRREALADRSRSASQLPADEDNVVREQSRLKPNESAGDEMHVAILEPVEERVNVTRREHVQVSRVVFGFSPREKPKPVLEAKCVRDGRDQASA